MYNVYHNNRVLKSIGLNFGTYDEGRCALRKYIRKLVKQGKYSKHSFGIWDSVSRNPTLFSHLGFEVRKSN